MQTHQISQPKPRRRLSIASLIVTPIKQHFGCCVLMPAMLKTIGSAGILGSILLYPKFHVYAALAMAPFVVWLCIKLEDMYHDRQHNRGHFAHGHAHHDAHHHNDCHTCEPCPVDHTSHGFWKRYGLNLVIAFALVFLFEHFHHHGNF